MHFDITAQLTYTGAACCAPLYFFVCVCVCTVYSIFNATQMDSAWHFVTTLGVCVCVYECFLCFFLRDCINNTGGKINKKEKKKQ